MNWIFLYGNGLKTFQPTKESESTSTGNKYLKSMIVHARERWLENQPNRWPLRYVQDISEKTWPLIKKIRFKSSSLTNWNNDWTITNWYDLIKNNSVLLPAVDEIIWPKTRTKNLAARVVLKHSIFADCKTKSYNMQIHFMSSGTSALLTRAPRCWLVF